MPSGIPTVPRPKDAPKRLTASLARAKVIRDPATNAKLPRSSTVFRKWESLADAR